MSKYIKILLIIASLCPLTPQAAQIELLPSRVPNTTLSLQKIQQMVVARFDVNQYRHIKAQIIYDTHNQPDHILVYLFSKKYHHVDITNLALEKKSVMTMKHYQLSQTDLDQQPGIDAEHAVCPNPNVEFIAFAPNDDDYEVSKALEVAAAAESHGLKTIRLVRGFATRTNYLNYMSCPNLKGNFYDGDSNKDLIVTADGVIYAHDIDRLLRNRFRFRVTNIWLACEAYNEPMLSSVVVSAQTQKYAAGINELQIGPSDETAVCTMKAAFDGKPLSVAFKECYDLYDKPADGWVDQWGFGGNGSDYFGI